MDYTFDLDGTLCTQPHPTEFGDAEPIRSRIEAVNRLYDEGHRILIDTARGSRTGKDWRALTEKQLAAWGVRYHELRVGQKRGAEVYVDDKAVSPDVFFGDGPTLAERRERSRDVAEFVREYADHLHAAMRSVDAAQVLALVEVLESARAACATVFIAANGGSAASAAHIANGLGFHLINTTGTGFRVQALTDNACALTAIPNDTDFENLFVGQLRQYWRRGDRLVVMSCSGNSMNLVRAAEWVNARGGEVIGLLGFDGGKLKSLCSTVLHVHTDAGEFGPVEDAHMALSHALIHWYQGVK